MYIYTWFSLLRIRHSWNISLTYKIHFGQDSIMWHENEKYNRVKFKEQFDNYLPYDLNWFTDKNKCYELHTALPESVAS